MASGQKQTICLASCCEGVGSGVRPSLTRREALGLILFLQTFEVQARTLDPQAVDCVPLGPSLSELACVKQAVSLGFNLSSRPADAHRWLPGISLMGQVIVPHLRVEPVWLTGLEGVGVLSLVGEGLKFGV